MRAIILIASLTSFRCLAANILPPAADKQLALDIYKEFIEIRSGYATGATTPVAEAAAARLRAAGFPESDIFLGGPIPKKWNIVVRYHGTPVNGALRKPILLLAHEDVVEAKREDWTTDPFQFIEKDGYYYGRGTSDDKAQAALWIANLIRYKREGFKPDRDIIVALTADEEGAGPYHGIAWLLKNHRDLIDADFALNEGGTGEMDASGHQITNNIQVAEKYVINFRLEVRNKGGHSSLPVADNAIYHLADALSRLSKFGFPLKTNAVTQAYFAQMAKTENGERAADMAKPLAAEMAKIGEDAGAVSSDARLEAMRRVAALSPAWNSILRTTCVATQLEGGHAMNALPQLAAATVNCRVLPEDSKEYVESELKKVFADDQVKVTAFGDLSRGPSSPMRQDILRAVNRVTDTLWPGVVVVPVMGTGATDGRDLRAAGIPAYGVQGLFRDRLDNRAHGRDERMRVQSFYEGQTFLYDLVKVLSQPGVSQQAAR